MAVTGSMYVVVQQVSITDKYPYEATVSLRNECNQNITKFPIRNTTESLEDVFDNRQCAVITEDQLYGFVRGNEIDMEVTIKKFRQQKWKEDPHS
jgi:hypothetical protein